MARIVVTLIMVLLGVSNAMAQNGKFAVPQDADLDKYPIFDKVLTVPEMARLELTAKELKNPMLVYNHYRGLRDKQGRFVLETLATGTVVLVDSEGHVRYKADCGNRLVGIESIITAEKVADLKFKEPLYAPYDSTTPVTENFEEEGFWIWVSNGLVRVGHGIVDGLRFILENLGWFLLLLLIAFLIYAILHEFKKDQNQVIKESKSKPLPVASLGKSEVVEPPLTATPDETGRGYIRFSPENVNRPHMVTWAGRFTFQSLEKRQDGSYTLRFTER